MSKDDYSMREGESEYDFGERLRNVPREALARYARALTGDETESDGEPEPVDEDGLNADERAACASLGCDPKDFLTLKAARRL